MTQTHRVHAAFMLLAAVAAGCGKADGAGPSGSSASSGTVAAASAAANEAPAAATSSSKVAVDGEANPFAPLAAALPGDSADIDKPAEHASDRLVGGSAKRAALRAVVDDAVLRLSPELVAAHFGATPPFPLEVQRVALHGGRQAVLVAASSQAIAPLIVVADEQGRALWAKRRPLAGTREQVKGLSLLAGPEGSIAIAWWDEPTHAVALRRWDFDGSVFADYHLFDADACDGLDAIYWPSHGWIVTVTVLAQGAARSHWVTESGLAGFGGAVLEVTSSERVTSGASAAAGIDGIFHAYLARPTGSSATESPSVWVALHHPDGSAAWKAPVRVAPTRPGFDPQAAPVVTLETPAILRVQVGDETFKVGSNGRVLERHRAPRD